MVILGQISNDGRHDVVAVHIDYLASMKHFAILMQFGRESLVVFVYVLIDDRSHPVLFIGGVANVDLAE